MCARATARNSEHEHVFTDKITSSHGKFLRSTSASQKICAAEVVFFSFSNQPHAADSLCEDILHVLLPSQRFLSRVRDLHRFLVIITRSPYLFFSCFSGRQTMTPPLRGKSPRCLKLSTRSSGRLPKMWRRTRRKYVGNEMFDAVQRSLLSA